MAITKNTADKKNYQNPDKKFGTADKKSKIKRTTDFSGVKLSLKLTITLILFVSGIVWFVAAQWVFDIRCEKLKNNIEEETSEEIGNLNKNKAEKTKIENLENQINKHESIINCLKIKGYFTKECFK